MAAGGTSIAAKMRTAVPVCGDVLPVQCYGRAYREISPRGIDFDALWSRR